MPSSGMWHQVGLVKIDISEKRIASVVRVEIISELGTTLAVTSKLKHTLTANVVYSSLILSTLKSGAKFFSETSILTRTTWHHIPGDGIQYYLYYVGINIVYFYSSLKKFRI
jgi:hypothetical protein